MKNYILILAIFILSALAAYSEQVVEDTTWKQVAQNIFINPEGIVGTEDIYGFTFVLKSFNKGQYEPINGRDVFYTMSRYTIDCSKNTYKIGVIDSYDKQGNFIYGDYNKYAKFQPIVQGTAVANVALKLCRM